VYVAQSERENLLECCKIFYSIYIIISVLTCEDVEIGVADKNVIPDASLTATSTISGYEATGARLDSAFAWKPSTNSDASDYLQVDLGKVYVQYKISTNVESDRWVQHPKVKIIRFSNRL